MRDFYDIHVISQQESFDTEVLKKAFLATSEKRDTMVQIPDFRSILSSVEADEVMKRQWETFKEDYFFVGGLSWENVMGSVKELAAEVIS